MFRYYLGLNFDSAGQIAIAFPVLIRCLPLQPPSNHGSFRQLMAHAPGEQGGAFIKPLQAPSCPRKKTSKYTWPQSQFAPPHPLTAQTENSKPSERPMPFEALGVGGMALSQVCGSVGQRALHDSCRRARLDPLISCVIEVPVNSA